MAQAWEAQPGLVDPKSWYEGYDEGKANAGAIVATLTAALQQIADMGPMAVDDQRWRIAREALGINESAPSV